MTALRSVQAWAEGVIAAHLDAGWSFEFDHAKRRAGACHYQTKRITVSRYVAARVTETEVHQIVLHEVAHALAGHRAAHGPHWRAIADRIGYVGARTAQVPVPTELASWVGSCPSGHQHYRFRRPTRPVSCRLCARGYRPEFGITWAFRRVSSAARRAARTVTAATTEPP